MSSPTTIVVVITSPPSQHKLECSLFDFHQEWLKDADELRSGRLFYTERALDNFFSNAIHGYNEGNEGDTVAWSYDGNYIDSEGFASILNDWARPLLAKQRFMSVTAMFQPHGGLVRVYKIDGTYPSPFQGQAGCFSFEVEIDKLVMK